LKNGKRKTRGKCVQIY